ncbi:MAG: glutamine--fructose-6-phosphate transaminase (isomerizing) [Actinobacteria bacterium]|nr:glutamine--fructose-6-phosphate transaminase (isomerizing) [Actinomycetota bacterium]
MCGIVGYVGEGECVDILMNGLKRLEYRGYDSTGIAVLEREGENCSIKVIKEAGYLKRLEEIVLMQKPVGNIGIGHTRWATHGEPNQINAHPHMACSDNFAVIHNGIIENYLELKSELILEGHNFRSDTDSEVIAHLLEKYYDGDLTGAVVRSINRIEGSGAFVFLCKEHPEMLVGARLTSPLIVGVGEGGNYFASDIPAVLEHTKRFIVINDGEIVELKKNSYSILDLKGNVIEREPFTVSWDVKAAEKSGFDDFMLKEIYEQPEALRQTIRRRLDDSLIEPGFGRKHMDILSDVSRIVVVAMGTSYHSSMIAKQSIENWARLPVELQNASEFRYSNPIISEGDLVLAITQSGETIDTLAAMKESRKLGARVMVVTNVVGSSASRETDGVIYTHAGPEIGVLATKTFTTQIAVAYMLGLLFARKRNMLTEDEMKRILEEIHKIPSLLEAQLNESENIKAISKKYYNFPDFLFLGRSYGMPVALEGALKLKEVSYIHAEGYPAGEMKHGPIALVDEECPVVAVALKGSVYEKMCSNIMEVKARNAPVIALATVGDREITKIANDVIYIPEVDERISAIPAILPLQLMAYYMAKLRGCNVDQPRNLAKSVTVE